MDHRGGEIGVEDSQHSILLHGKEMLAVTTDRNAHSIVRGRSEFDFLMNGWFQCEQFVPVGRIPHMNHQVISDGDDSFAIAAVEHAVQLRFRVFVRRPHFANRIGIGKVPNPPIIAGQHRFAIR